MKKTLFILALFTHSLLQASEFGTIFMSTTLFTLFITLIFTLTLYLKKIQKERLKNRALFDYSDVPTILLTTNGTISDLNQSAQTLLGYTKKRLVSQKWYEKLLPDEPALQIRHQVHQTLKTDARCTFSSYLIRSNGQILEIDYTLSALPRPHKGNILTLVDVTKSEALKDELMSVQEHLNETKTALQKLSEQFKATFDIAINGIALLNEDGNIIYFNRALTEMYEYNNDYILQLGLRLIVDDNESAQLLLKSVKQGEKIDKMHITSLTRSGNKLDIDLTMGYLPQIKQYYLVVQDITKALAFTDQLQQNQKSLEKRVVTDYLTSAYNRSHMEEILEDLVYVQKAPFGFILLDIDHFKNVNDTYGHLVGDDVLVNLVNALKMKLRSTDTLARFGGEEFTIILPHTTHQETLHIAHKLQAYVASLNFEECPQVTCSFGVASFDGTQDKRTLLLSADKALYRAKEDGRNRVVDARSLSEGDYSI